MTVNIELFAHDVAVECTQQVHLLATPDAVSTLCGILRGGAMPEAEARRIISIVQAGDLWQWGGRTSALAGLIQRGYDPCGWCFTELERTVS